jgi:hypothetical protein
MSKTAIVILSDPRSGSDESFGRAFNALAVAYDYKTAGEEVSILFQGAATRWPEEMLKPDHALNALFKAVEDKVAGVSCGCADAFGANASGFDLVTDNRVPGTTGLPSFVKLKSDGYEVLTF